MATVVDSLVVSLGLDASNFNAGQKRMVADLRNVEAESTRTAKAMQASGKQAAEYFSAIKTEVLSLLGVFLGGKGIESFVKDTTRSLADFGRTVGQLGSNGQQVQAFELAIKRMGGSIEAAHGSLLGLAKAKQDFITLGAGAQSFQFMSIMGATPNMTPLEIMERFGAYAKRTVNLPGGESQIRQIGEGSGIDTSTILAMIQIAKTSTLAEEMRRSFELGAVASKDLIESSTKFQTSVASFDQAVKGFSNTFLGKTLTSLTVAIDGLTEYLIHPPQAPTPEDIAKALETPSTFDASGAFTFGQGPGWIGQWFRDHWKNPYRSDNPSTSAPNAADTSMSPEKRAFLDTLAAGEQNAAGYASQNPSSSAYGRYQFINSTDAQISRETGIAGNDPISQDRKAWYLAEKTYRRFTFGRDLEQDIRSGGHEAMIAMALRGEWPSLPGGSQQNTTPDQFVRRMQENIARETGPGVRGQGPMFPKTHLPDPALTPRRMLKREDMMAPSPGAVSTTSVNVNTVNVHAPGGDPHTIAREFNRALTDEVNAQSNRGLR